MSRRSKPEKREIPPDVRYGSVNVQNFINRVFGAARKVATSLVYDAFDMIEERTKRNPLEVFDQAVKNVSPWWRSSRDVWVARLTRCRWKFHRTGVSLWLRAGS
jgi:ribosomal protein S7